MKRTRKIIAAMCLAATVCACGADSPNDEADLNQRGPWVADDGGNLAGLDPVADTVLTLPDGWFELWGYGTVLRVEGDEVTPLYLTASTCTEGEPFDNELSVDHAQGRPDDGVIIIDLVGPTTDYRLRPLVDRPDCRAPADRSIDEVRLTALDEVFSRHYPFFEERGVDWQREFDAIRAAVEADPSDFESSLTDFMLTLADGHTTLDGLDIDPDLDSFGLAGDETIDDVAASLENELTATIDRVVDLRTDEAGSVGWGRLDDPGGSVGYLLLVGFEGEDEDEDVLAVRDAFIDATDAAIAELDADVDRLIVDVRFNGGGAEDLAVLAAGHFVDQPTAAYRKWPYAEPDPEIQTVVVEPRATRFTGDVVVLTSPITASAAEAFTMAMAEVADATVIGSPSFGEFSDAIDWVLPGGTEFTLSMEVYTDLEGGNHESAGIPVDIATSFDQTLDVAIEHLTSPLIDH